MNEKKGNTIQYKIIIMTSGIIGSFYFPLWTCVFQILYNEQALVS